jgi:hypothetical protein
MTNNQLSSLTKIHITEEKRTSTAPARHPEDLSRSDTARDRWSLTGNERAVVKKLNGHVQSRPR